MAKSDIKLGIGSFKARLESRKADAIKAIEEGYYLAAQSALNDCIRYEAVIEELEFQLEVDDD